MFRGFFRDFHLALATLLIVSVASVAAIFPNTAHAADIRCDWCNSPWDYEDQARYAGDGNHVVYNLSTFQAYAFDVSWGGGPVELEGQVSVVSLGQVWQNELAPYQAFAAETGGTMTLMAVISIEDLNIGAVPPGTNAYDIVRSVELRGRIADRLNQGGFPGIGANASAFFQTIRTGSLAPLIGSEVRVRIEVQTSDGKVVFVKTASTDQYQYQPGESRGKNGHVIPENLSEAVGSTWTSQGGYDMDAMFTHLSAMNAQFVLSSGSSGAGCTGIYSIASVTTRDDEGNVTGQFFELVLIC